MLALYLRDMKLAFRAGGGFGLALAFFLILVGLIPFGVGPTPELLSLIAPGILWVGALLACLLSLDRIFALDREDGSLDLLATAPIPLEAVVIAKAAAHWTTTGLALACAAPVFGILLNLPAPGHFWLFVTLLVGTPAMSVIGAFGAALTVGLKRGGLLLSILVLPLYVPTLLLGAQTVADAVAGIDVTTTLTLLSAITAGSIALLPFATAAALRINLR
ncbi:MAG: heme exporter protein CcmB [Pseudomonadota bacterium]